MCIPHSPGSKLGPNLSTWSGSRIWGLTLLDHTELEAISAACAQEGRWAFLVMMAPWRFGRGGLDGVDAVFEVLGDPEKHAKILIRPRSSAVRV